MNQLLEYLSNPLILAVIVPLVGGLLGTTLEAIGEKTGRPWLVALGQRIEAALADVPKLMRGSRKTAEEKAEKPKDPDEMTPPTGTARPVTIPPPAKTASWRPGESVKFSAIWYAYALLLACSSPQKPNPLCTTQHLAAIEAAYIAEAVEACAGESYDSCPALPALRAKYAAKREEWKACQ